MYRHDLPIKRSGALAAALGVSLLGLAGFVQAQNAQSTPAPRTAASSENLLGLGEIESRLSAQGITIKEIELRNKLAEIEGYDANGRKIELVLDRRNGETLSQKFDD